MWIIRDSNEPIATVAIEGQYNHQIEKRSQISLVRILLDDKVSSNYISFLLVSGGS